MPRGQHASLLHRAVAGRACAIPRSSISPRGGADAGRLAPLPVSAWPSSNKRIGSSGRRCACAGDLWRRAPELRARWNDTGYYKLYAGAGTTRASSCSAATTNPAQWTTVHEFPLRRASPAGAGLRTRTALIGQTFTVKFNREVLGTITDGTFPEGQFGMRSARARARRRWSNPSKSSISMRPAAPALRSGSGFTPEKMPQKQAVSWRTGRSSLDSKAGMNAFVWLPAKMRFAGAGASNPDPKRRNSRCAALGSGKATYISTALTGQRLDDFAVAGETVDRMEIGRCPPPRWPQNGSISNSACPATRSRHC